MPFTNTLLAVVGVAVQLINPGFDSSELAASAVFLAAATNGTLAQSAAGWTYSAVPADKLILQFTNGVSTTLYVGAIAGDFSSSADILLRNDHDFEFRIVTPSLLDLQISSSLNSGSFSAVATGSISYSNSTYAVNLSAAGQHFFSTDSTGTELTDDYGITGTITAASFSLSVNQHHYFSLVQATLEGTSL